MTKNLQKLKVHICPLERQIPQSLSGTSFQLRKFSPASNLSFLSLFIYFFKAHCLCGRVKIKDILLSPLYLLLYVSVLSPSTPGLGEPSILHERVWKKLPCFFSSLSW